MTLIKNRYVATDSDIAKLTTDHLGALETAIATRGTYLRALVATAQAELGAEPRLAAPRGRLAKLSPEDAAKQLEALQRVHERFYAVVTKTAGEGLSGKGAADELNRRTNFARTALYAARTWLRAGNDLTALVVPKLTKATLAVRSTQRVASPRRLKTRVENLSKAVMSAMMELETVDKPGAVAELETLMGQLTARLIELGGTETRDPKRAVAERRPLRVGSTRFFPTETQVLRQTARPS